MTDLSTRLQKILESTRTKPKKNKPQSEKVGDAETEEATKDEMTKIQTASAEIDGRHKTADEWDAGKTPPSRFQQMKGSVYATPKSRDSHIDRHADRDAKFHELHDRKFGSSKGKVTGSKDEA
ncbi:hypothetical protein OIDMADRAFT_54838 [Oidiodendron maius Zn]|uniref:Uncharacterized protein n=1 Tax=Oidiodendron maius (strain Zn) TaxID=913774 RepID=A0A0C3DE39_OIDMZ|nr:hypothetical protein OIDMADRAFT_54838 [Oidiodendron maius Zn]